MFVDEIEGMSIMGSPISMQVDGENISNSSADNYYADLGIKEDLL